MAAPMPPEARLVELTLRVRDLEACRSYYVDGLGLEEAGGSGAEAVLRPGAGGFVLRLRGEPDAPVRPYPCTGMYHFALLVPDRAALGAVTRRVLERRLPVEGMADHAVSEALYLRDPEMNGIELYWDRPRTVWPVAGGEVRMVADPLDLDGVLASADASAPVHPDTRFGHVHLHVRDLAEAEEFFAGRLGLKVTQRSYPGALFCAAGDYHHHVGLNTWAPKIDVPEGAAGLVSYTWAVPGAASEVLHDPAGVEVVVRSA